MKKIFSIILAMVLILSLSACGGSNGNSSHDISTLQMQQDLINIDERILVNEYLFVQFDSDTDFDDFVITKTLTEDNVVQYYVDVSASSLYAPNFWYYESFGGTLIISYKRYEEGWDFTGVSVKEFVSGERAE